MPVIILAVIVVWLARRARLHSWWNPVSWWNDAAGAAGSVASNIKGWVLDAIRGAVNLVSNDLSDLARWSSDAFNLVERDIGTVSGYAFRLWSDAIGYIQRGLSGVEGVAYRLWSDAIGYAQRGLADVEGVAYRLWSDAIGYAQRGLADLQGWVSVGLRDTVSWALREIESAYNAVYRAVKSDFIDPIMVVLDVVKKAFDWIVWFAEHPFKVVHDVENDVLQWADHLPDDVAKAVEGQDFLRGLDAASKWLGG